MSMNTDMESSAESGERKPSPRRSLAAAMHQWGPRGVVGFAVAFSVVVVVLLVAYIQGGEPIADTGIGDTTVVRLVPTSGEKGFNLEDFVCGPNVDVELEEAPDGSAGTYLITRTLNGVFESVKLIQGAPSGTHYWDGDNNVQQSEPAFVTDKTLQCIEEKRK